MLSRRVFLGHAGALGSLSAFGNRVLGLGNGKLDWLRPAEPSATTPSRVAPSALASSAEEQGTDSAMLERARVLLKKAPLIDTHNDLPTMLIDANAGDLTRFDMGVAQPTMSADIPGLREGCVGAEYWVVYCAADTQKTHTALHETLRSFDIALRIIRSRPELEQARTADDIERVHASGRIASLLCVEGGHMIENSPAVLRIFYELGARYMTLTHWNNVDWADSGADRAEHNGLTHLGQQLVREMNRLGMFVDISHCSADTMRDALRVTRAPVLFSHSTSYAVDGFAMDGRPRSVPDDCLKMLRENGGVIHVNFVNGASRKDMDWQAERKKAIHEIHGRFESDEAMAKEIEAWEGQNPNPRSTMADIVEHIDHIRDVAGIDHIGIGADFYGPPTNMVAGLDNVRRYPYLFAALLSKGYSDEDVLKIAGRNHLRAMRQMERVAAELQKSEQPLITEGVKA
jgi:membrane dipeptidase